MKTKEIGKDIASIWRGIIKVVKIASSAVYGLSWATVIVSSGVFDWVHRKQWYFGPLSFATILLFMVASHALGQHLKRMGQDEHPS